MPIPSAKVNQTTTHPGYVNLQASQLETLADVAQFLEADDSLLAADEFPARICFWRSVPANIGPFQKLDIQDGAAVSIF